MALTDLEKCYDNIWREGLYFVLYSFGVRGDMLRNIKSLDRKHSCFSRVEWGDLPESDPKGGPQAGMRAVASRTFGIRYCGLEK